MHRIPKGRMKVGTVLIYFIKDSDQLTSEQFVPENWKHNLLGGKARCKKWRPEDVHVQMILDPHRVEGSRPLYRWKSFCNFWLPPTLSLYHPLVSTRHWFQYTTLTSLEIQIQGWLNPFQLTLHSHRFYIHSLSQTVVRWICESEPTDRKVLCVSNI